jgi:PadR family transcriptional regulator, regulatory protein PadR
VIERELFLGFIKINILHYAAKKSVYGTEIAEKLSRHGYAVSPGTLYPTLHHLEECGYLKSKTEVVSGKMRKYYLTTDKGMRILEKSRQKIKELFTEVMGG